MKRTIKEVYNLIEQKRNNAFNDFTYNNTRGDIKMAELKGEVEAYDDVLNLISTSCILTDADDQEQLKKILWLIPIKTILETLVNTNQLELLEWFKNFIERRAKNDK